MPDLPLDLFGSPPGPQSDLAPASEPRMFSVTEVTRVVRGVLEAALDDVWVQGEISNYRQQASGHQYFTLKDTDSQLACVRFARPGMWRKNIALQDGMQVQVRGRLTVYEARGQYQLNVSVVQPAGAGLLQAKFEALKRKLATEGLFDPERKRPLPRFPRAIGIVTSPSGAALKDMLNVLARRAPWLRVVISPARVQGEGAAAEIITALREVERVAALKLAPIDVVVVARGGGSMEDLWEFNHEGLARAIAACPLPVVSAVGHEIDFTIADFVADLRAPTPSAAAELIAPDTAELHRQLQQRAAFFERHVLSTLASWIRHLAGLARSTLFREPQMRIEQITQRLDSAEQTLTHACKTHLARLQQSLADHASELRQHRPDRHLALLRQRIEPLGFRLGELFERAISRRGDHIARLSGLLRLLSPEHTLLRGYSLTTNAEGQILRSAKDVREGDIVVTSLRDGKVISTVRGETGEPPVTAPKRKRPSKRDNT